MRKLNIFLILMLCMLQFRLWAGEGSVGSVVSLQQKIEKQTQINTGLRERNDLLAAEVLSLQQGYDSIEEYARSQLGLIKPDETFFLVVNSKTQ